MNKLTETAPATIYLQSGISQVEALETSFSDLNSREVTWCADKVEETDIEYLRADVSSKIGAEYGQWLADSGYSFHDVARHPENIYYQFLKERGHV